MSYMRCSWYRGVGGRCFTCGEIGPLSVLMEYEYTYICNIYIDNTDGVGNPARCIHQGGPFAGPGSRGRRLPRPWACKRPPKMDTGCEDFLPRLYCIYFTPCSRIVCIVHALYNLCQGGQGGGMGKNYF